MIKRALLHLRDIWQSNFSFDTIIHVYFTQQWKTLQKIVLDNIVLNSFYSKLMLQIIYYRRSRYLYVYMSSMISINKKDYLMKVVYYFSATWDRSFNVRNDGRQDMVVIQGCVGSAKLFR